MADFTRLNGYNVKDSVAREGVSSLELTKASHDDVAQEVATLNESISEVSKGLEDLETLFNASGVSNSATDISFNNTLTGLEATNVQSAIEEVKAIAESNTGATASDTTFDNTASGLEATNVQSAIEEIVDELTLDYSEASEEVTNVNTLLQNLLNRFFPDAFYLLHEGVITEGYEVVGSTHDTTHGSNYTFSNGLLHALTGYGVTFVGFKIDLTNVSSIKFKARATSEKNIVVGVWNDINGSSAVSTEYTNSTTFTELTVDTLSCIGEHYIGLSVYSSTENSTNEGYISEIELI